MRQMPLTAARARELFSYDPATGELRNLVNRKWAHAGALAGHLRRDDGSLRARIDGRRYQVDQVVWLVAYGAWPASLIGHINKVRSDNRLSNLRLSSRGESLRNAKLHKNNSSGFTGVSWEARRKLWLATIGVDNRAVYLGHFKDKDEAAAAYERARARLTP
jgi:hypothetical protein